MVAQKTVNLLAIGSNPIRGAISGSGAIWQRTRFGSEMLGVQISPTGPVIYEHKNALQNTLPCRIKANTEVFGASNCGSSPHREASYHCGVD